MIDSEKIIFDTLEVFNRSPAQKKKFADIKSFISKDRYKQLHKSFLTSLLIKIDCDLFVKEIDQYSEYFEQWGTQHTHLPRYGLALVNQDGVLKKQDPVNGSLYEWNEKNPTNPLIESDCKIPTEVMTLKSLKPLSDFDTTWYRSNILKWHDGAEFKPHIDTVIPSPWFRLWGTTDSDNTIIRYWDENTQSMKNFTGIESGRIYLIDTSIVHDAYSTGNVYQFFLSLDPVSSKKLESLIIDK
jgi:hypothetical protein